MIRESGRIWRRAVGGEGNLCRHLDLLALNTQKTQHNEEERGQNSSAAAGGLNPYILAASLAAHPERFDHGFPFIDRVAIFASCTTRHAMARETATALREANEDGPAKTVALQEQVPIESPL